MLEQHFPALKHFKIGNMPEETESLKLKNYKKLNNYNITMFIHLNPQLKSLWIIFDKYKLEPNFDGIKWNYEILEAIHSNLTGLEGFHVEVVLDKHEVDIPEFHFSQLKNLTINVSKSGFPNKFPITVNNNKLETLGIFGYRGFDLFKYYTDYENLKVFKSSGTYTYKEECFNLFMTRHILDMLSDFKSRTCFKEIHFSYDNYASIIKIKPQRGLTVFTQLSKLVINANNVNPVEEQKIYNELCTFTKKYFGWEADLQSDWESGTNYRLIFTKKELRST